MEIVAGAEGGASFLNKRAPPGEARCGPLDAQATSENLMFHGVATRVKHA